MTTIPSSSKQPVRQPWTADRLLYERSILLGMAIDNSTATTYTSATNSYLTFCMLHNMPIDPTAETLSYYVTFQSSHINPKSVESYLSGICNNLEPFFPEIRANRASALVKRTLKGALRRHGRPTKRKSPLTTAHLQSIATHFINSRDHDDMLFLCMLNTGFPGLLRLGEMAVTDNLNLRDFRKVVLRSSLTWVGNDFEFLLPTHKTDTTFEGNRVHIAQIIGAPDPKPIMASYIRSRDRLFPLHPQLWLRVTGVSPTRSWFLRRLKEFCPADIAGQSMRAGGATVLAQAGASVELIRGAGRWSSDAFERYIRKNVVVLHALILGRALHYSHAT
jgi:hypothetical protein